MTRHVHPHRERTGLSGRTISYRRWDGGPGTPVVLLHGIFSTADHWETHGYVERLVTERPVIAIDALAHGESARPADLDDYRLARRAADIVAVLDDLALDQAHVWGYSMGGWNALGCAAFAADRCRAVVVGGWDPARGLDTAYDAFTALLGLPEDTDWFEGLVTLGRGDPGNAAEIERGDEAAFRRCHRAAEEENDLAHVVTGHAGPMLLACGGDDPYHGSMASLADVAGKDFATLPGDHGRAWLDGPAAVDAVAPFLRRHD